MDCQSFKSSHCFFMYSITTDQTLENVHEMFLISFSIAAPKMFCIAYCESQASSVSTRRRTRGNTKSYKYDLNWKEKQHLKVSLKKEVNRIWRPSEAKALNRAVFSFSLVEKVVISFCLAVFPSSLCCQAPAGLVSLPLSLFSYKLRGSVPVFFRNSLSRMCWLKCPSAFFLQQSNKSKNIP